MTHEINGQRPPIHAFFGPSRIPNQAKQLNVDRCGSSLGGVSAIAWTSTAGTYAPRTIDYRGVAVGRSPDTPQRSVRSVISHGRKTLGLSRNASKRLRTVRRTTPCGLRKAV